MIKHPVMFVFSLFLILFHDHGLTQVSGADDGFIKTDGVQFILNGAPFYSNGFNAYWLMDVASNPSQRSKITSAFQGAVGNSLMIGRTWAFSDGTPNSLQPSRGVYNENWFQGLDFVISEASKFGVKLILALVNNFDDYGGKPQYVEWAKQQGQQIQNGSDGFYTNPMVQGFYKNHIKTVLTRRNTITGVVYKEDSTIMAWELMNEPRCPTDVSGATLQNWILEMGGYLKSIDGNHLLSAGLEGFYEPSSSQKNPNNAPHGTDFIANHQIPQIDFATVHAYPQRWLPPKNATKLEFLKHWIHDHINDTQHVLRKPVLFGEFGKSSKDPGYNVSQRDEMYNMIYSSIYKSARSNGAAAGGLFWHLLVEGMDSYKDGMFNPVTQTYPDSATELKFLRRWINNHILDAQHVLRKSILLMEFGKSLRDPGYTVTQRDASLNETYNAIYNSASVGGAAAGFLFWQQPVEGMDSFQDGFEIILSEPSTTIKLITEQSKN